MAAYIADSDTWSTCNGGSRPADGDEITVDAVLYMDENSASAESFTVIVPANCNLFLDGFTLEGNVLVGGVSSRLDFSNGLIYMGTVSATADGAIITLFTTGAINGGMNANGFTVVWYGSGTLDCSLAVGVLDLGGAATGLAITTTAATTLASALVAKSLSVGADWNDGGNNVTVEDLLYVAGTPTMTGIYAVRDTFIWTLQSSPIPHLVTPDGYTLVSSSIVCLRKVTVGTGLNGIAWSLLGARMRFLPNATNPWIQPEGSGQVQGYWHWNIRPYANIDLGRMDIKTTGSSVVTFYAPTAGTPVITQTGDWLIDTATDVLMRASGGSMGIVLGDYITRLASKFTMGYPGGSSPMTLTLAGTVFFGGGLSKTATTIGAHVLNMGSGRVRLTGILDCANITVTNAFAKIIGGTVQNVDAHLTDTIKAYRATDGGSNQNVIFRKRMGSQLNGSFELDKVVKELSLV